MRLDDWFLRRDERGNPATSIDARHPDGVAWTEGNRVTPLIDGAAYFEELAACASALQSGGRLQFTDWRGDGDERLDDRGTDVAALLSDLCRRGIDVRGLLWRSHSDRLLFNKRENRTLAEEVDAAGGEVLLDERVRRGGSHHQKLIVLRQPDDPSRAVAFVGGIDLSHGRHDDSRHRGDVQAVRLDKRYGPRPPWHDIQAAVRGPAVGDLDFTFRERWEDPTPLDHSNPARAIFSRGLSRERRGAALPAPLPDPEPAGTHAVQVLRTYPCRRPAYRFAPSGERSIARAYTKAFARARRLIYLEDQYLWSAEIAGLLADALRGNPELHLIAVLPRFPDQGGRLSAPPNLFAQQRAMDLIRDAGSERVSFYDLENDEGKPVYVHAKVCVIDDVWAAVGSDNLNRRSWTHDSELACAVVDAELDQREPLDPGGLGDGARCFARDLRIALCAEHLAMDPTDPALVDVRTAPSLWRERAGGPGHVREHRQERRVGRTTRSWADLAYRLVFDPDGRPRAMRRSGRF